MTSEGLGEMFEGDSADMCARKFPLMSMGGRAKGLPCLEPGAWTPMGVSGNLRRVIITFLPLPQKDLRPQPTSFEEAVIVFCPNSSAAQVNNKI